MIINRKMATRALQNNRVEPKNKTKNEKTVYLYGPIGGWFGIDAEQFIKDLNDTDAETIHLRIDSEGGDVFKARSIKTALMQHKAHVIAHIDGLAASAASFLMMGADEIEMTDGAFIMIHNATSFLDILGFFNLAALDELIMEFGQERSLHEKINDSIAADYAKRTGIEKDNLLTMMAKETWFTAQEAIDAGFIDRVYDGEPVEGSYDLSIFNRVPNTLKSRNHTEKKRAIEKALRDAGLSREEAKDIVAAGYRDKREAEPEDQSTTDELVQQHQRDAEAAVQRDAETPVNEKRDDVAELLIRAELVAPSL